MERVNRRASRALKTPFEESDRQLLAARLSWWSNLEPTERLRMEELIRVFLVDKTIEGVFGYSPDDEVRVLIAAQACLLILGLDYGFYDDVSAIVVSPGVVVQRGSRRLDGGVVSDDHPRLAGQAMLHGPVLLVWDRVANDARHPERGHNVVLHEFAHKLDMRNGAADGVPPLTATLSERWRAQMPELLARLRAGTVMPIDAYAATNPAEFLAVATEAFFVLPVELADAEPELYLLLQEFYRQDPKARDRS
ncbi:MAG: zinc-dependent peptidase [Acidimicrobiia bacterium]|nr:zinc-dependent peptidase [Acidimicrobiia bacterium]